MRRPGAIAGESRSGDALQAAGRGPSDRALDRLAGWYAIGLRLGSAVIYAVVGPLAATSGVSGWWLAAVIFVLCGWSAVFAWLVRRDGLAWPVVLADVAVIGALVSTQRHVVPAGLIVSGATWMLSLASTSVFILQLALRPVFSLPAAGVVTIAYAVSVRHPPGTWILVVQAVVTAVLMALVRTSGRRADTVIAAGLRAEQELRAEAARRARGSADPGSPAGWRVRARERAALAAGATAPRGAAAQLRGQLPLAGLRPARRRVPAGGGQDRDPVRGQPLHGRAPGHGNAP